MLLGVQQRKQIYFWIKKQMVLWVYHLKHQHYMHIQITLIHFIKVKNLEKYIIFFHYVLVELMVIWL